MENVTTKKRRAGISEERERDWLDRLSRTKSWKRAFARGDFAGEGEKT